MSDGIYTALSGSIARAHEVDLIANNLANANTPGYKRDLGTFQEYLTEARRPEAVVDPGARPEGSQSLVELDGIYTDYRQGSLQRTSRPLDLALDGPGFFEVSTPAGVRYTRQGNFTLDATGRLVTANGFPVVSAGSSSEIRLARLPMRIAEDGNIWQDGKAVARVSVREFAEPQRLEKSGNSYYRDTGAKPMPDAPRTRLVQGFIEGSNVNPVSEMTRLIEATRAYESHLQAIRTYQEIEGRAASGIAGIRP